MTVMQFFSLLFWALIGSCLVVFRPGDDLSKKLAGMSLKEMVAFYRQKDEREISRGCRILPGILFEAVQKGIVEPCYALWALSAHIQPLLLAYGAFGISVLYVLNVCIPHSVQKSDSWVNWFYWGRVAVFALPICYLWFLVVVIGLKFGR